MDGHASTGTPNHNHCLHKCSSTLGKELGHRGFEAPVPWVRREFMWACLEHNGGNKGRLTLESAKGFTSNDSAVYNARMFK